ncbi:MAG TPA: alpha/beta fold hydrolase [Candidatus Saccharimonadales bacterium]
MIYIISAILLLVIVLFVFYKMTGSETETISDASREATNDAFVQLTNGWTHYELSGPAEGILVVLVPGMTLQQYVWDYNVAALTKAGYRVLRYDLIGRGLSDKPNIVYNTEVFKSQLTELINKLGVTQPVHIVGLAFGGLVAAQFAETFPERVRSLTLMTSDGFGTHLSLGARLSLAPIIGTYLGHTFGNRIMLKRLDGYSADSRVVKEIKQRFTPHLRQKGFKRALLSALRNMPIYTAEATFAKIAASKLPTLILWGEKDVITPLTHAEAIRAVVPGAEFTVFDGLGHMPQYEAPALFNARLLQFLNSH